MHTYISIHAPRKGERPTPRATPPYALLHFNPRSPQGGATIGFAQGHSKPLFQSTLPARGSDHFIHGVFVCFCHFNPRSPQGGATLRREHDGVRRAHFNPRSPQGGATAAPQRVLFCPHISIHAPRKGERQISVHRLRLRFGISIHAPRKGERHDRTMRMAKAVKISIHAPRKGERPVNRRIDVVFVVFQSTLPARGSDDKSGKWGCAWSRFQSTLPARGSDQSPEGSKKMLNEFQSTLPARGSDEPSHGGIEHVIQDFNPRSPQGGATAIDARAAQESKISIHAPRKGERLFGVG